jgi:lysophospholipase L1-like esterase
MHMFPRRRWLVRTLQVVLGLVVGLGLTEAIFWWRDDGAFPHLNVYRSDAQLGVRLVPGAEQRLAFGGNPVTRVRINRDGYRGADLPKPAADRDEILVVGDSQVFGLGVEERETFSARLGARLGAGALVINGGVPTYGPAEYRAVAAELLARRPVKTVVFTINMVNDLFEAGRPNAVRHAVWDGWAVRRESSPGAVTWFPGRHFLYNRSHAFFALRRWWHARGPSLDDRGFASEGTWHDLVAVGTTSQDEKQARALRLQRRGADVVDAEAELREAEATLDAATFRSFDDAEHTKLRAARANPGDIIGEGSPNAEASRSIYVTTELIRQGTKYREQLRVELLAQARARGDQALIDAFASRESLLERLSSLDRVPELAAFESPLAPILRDVKALCDAHGARLVVLVLPIDVQVSTEEWKKYGAEPIDMTPTRALTEDVVAAATAMGVTALDATPALAVAEPGAFLHRDIHMTPRGHQAVADALAEALAAPPPVPASGRIAADRSLVPIPSAWKTVGEVTVTGSSKANCETKRVREWLRVACRQDGRGLQPTDLRVEAGGGDALTLVMPDATTLVAPLVPGEDLDVDFGWTTHTRRLTVRWPDGAAAPTIGFGDAVTRARPLPRTYDFRSPTEKAICTCWRDTQDGDSCNGVYGAADAGCVRAYADDCGRMLACVRRDPASPPASP